MAKQAKTDRQAVIDSIRSQQSKSENRRGLAIVGACVLVAVVIIGAAAFKPIKDWYDLRQFNGKGLSEIGAPASACGERTFKKANGNQDHVQPGTPINYPDSPPAFGESSSGMYSLVASTTLSRRDFSAANQRPRIDSEAPAP